jgi:fatty acid desaturase
MTLALRHNAVWQMASALLAASDARATPPARAGQGRDSSRYVELKRRVRAQGLLARQPGFYAAKLALTLAFVLLAVGWVWATATTGWVWLGPFLAAFASGQLALLGHDAAHHAIFDSRRANTALSVVLINLLNGGSAGWWTKSHNEHHARSNDPDFDPDVAYPFFAFSEAQLRGKDARFHPVLARQHVLAFCAMALVGLNLRVYGFAFALRRPERRVELLAMLAFWVAYPTGVIAALGPARGLLFIALHQALFGVYVGLITAMNHWGMPMPQGSHTLDFVEHQVVTSRNIAGGALVDLCCGGLNRQIEHHLFPTMARNNLKRARPIVEAYCREQGIAYCEAPPLEALRDVFTALRDVARRVPAGTAAPATQREDA